MKPNLTLTNDYCSFFSKNVWKKSATNTLKDYTNRSSPKKVLQYPALFRPYEDS